MLVIIIIIIIIIKILKYSIVTRCVLFCDITQRIRVIPYRRFGKIYRSHLPASRNPRRKPVTSGKQFTQGKVWAVIGYQ